MYSNAAMLRVLAFSPVAVSGSSPSFNTHSSSSFTPSKRRLLKVGKPHGRGLPNLKRLTHRVVQLTRRRQLQQIFDEIETAKTRYGKLNTIVMNAVLEACVHCGDIDSALKLFDEMSNPESCGVDGVTYSTLLKGLGEARRIDEAFHLLESVEQGTAVGNPKLSAPLIIGFLNALIELGDLRRANGLLARYGLLLREGGRAIWTYNLLMKGYINTGSPEAALALHDEILKSGLTPDRLSYNTLISACVKTQNLDAAMRFMEEMKDKAQKYSQENLYPDIFTYTTLIQGFGNAKDLVSIQKLVVEMKCHHNLSIDRFAFTVMVDAFLCCGSTKDALCVFGEVLKLAPVNLDLRPKPRLYLSMMREFASLGDYSMVETLHKRLRPDSTGTIAHAVQEEADHLLMEAALNDGQVDLAMQNLINITEKWKGISWTSRGGMVAMRIEALMGFNNSIFSPCLLSQLSLDEPIENIMVPLKEAQPLLHTLELKTVAMRVLRDQAVPIVDEWGSCIGILHREDCTELNAPLETLMRSPPPCVTITTSAAHVINLMLEKKYRMVVVVKYSSSHDSKYSSASRAVGVFTAQQLHKLMEPASSVPGQEKTSYRMSIDYFDK